MRPYIEHANKEFELAGWNAPKEDGKPCELQAMVMNNVRELLDVFGKQGHSGSSAPYVLNLFRRLVDGKNISPLTGAESEWNDVGGGTYQNNRCGKVFKEGVDGKAYNFQGRVFRHANGSCYTSSESRVYIDFPYNVPDKPEYVDVP